MILRGLSYLPTLIYTNFMLTFKSKSEFQSEVRKRVRAYFKENQKSMLADYRYYFKAVANLALYLVPFVVFLMGYQSFGMTETVSHIALRKVGYESAYTCLPNVSVAKGDQDELLIRAPPITGQEVLRTQDVVSVINDQQFIWKGRLDFIINSGGVKICPEEVEAHCSKHIAEPHIVSSLPDKALGQVVVLCIELSDEQSLERIHQMLDAIDFPKYHRPKKVLRIPEIPRLDNGKIDRLAVKEFLQ